MTIIAVDDEILVLNHLIKQIEKAVSDTAVHGFLTGAEALTFAESHRTDIAFLDIEMSDMTGIELAAKLKTANPRTNIVFVTGYVQYAYDAMQVFPSGYILKPAGIADIQKQLSHLREPLVLETGDKLTVQTFGNFDVKKNGKSVHFTRSKSKEIFAYLVDRKGAAVTSRELGAVLWEDKPFDKNAAKQISNCIVDMIKSLKAAGSEKAVIKLPNAVAVAVEEIDCDYYRFIRGDTDAINSFMNEYMTNYTWAEFTLGALLERKNQ